ncbi:MAG: helix-turn-helix domain-containing protein, partial [Clostridia bacterium]|nr:helix-turn-helix domain-containing protein [Clostridia bacterium]
MEKKTIGAFLSALRKANGMTQQEVADKLNVSNKTVSKWERDEGCPEIMMLPALAELYSVTVDEILRGERIVKEYEQQKNSKSQERIKYLIERATVKFTDCSIASTVLGAAALLLVYTVGEIISYDYIWLGYVIALLLLASSVTVILIAFNNLISGLKGTGDEAGNECEEVIKKAIKYITAVSFLTFVTLAGLVACFIFDGPDFMLVVLSLAAMAGALELKQEN